jgi:hypothetical protein
LNDSQVQAVWPYFALVLLFLGMLFGFTRLLRKARTENVLPVFPTRVEG